MVQEPDTARILNDLVQRSAAARANLHAAAAHFRERANVPARVRESLRGHPLGWIGGSAALGLLGSLLFRSASRHKSKRAEKDNADRKHPLAWLATAALVTAKPIATRWITSRLTTILANWQGNQRSR